MKRGQVIRIRAGRYNVNCDGKFYECSARGQLRIKSDGIVPGDYVEIDERSRTIDKVLPRKNLFIRPNVANVDTVNIVVASPPEPDFYMLDKLILSLLSKEAEIIISVNKSDINSDIFAEIYKNYSQIGCSIIQVSARTGYGIDELKEKLKGKFVAFAGQSAVGKSSLINALFGLDIRTNDVSDKTQRGRHTTTATRIYEFDGVRVADTPGFSAIIPDLLPEEAGLFYPEYFALLPECRYRGCTHTGEPGCAVSKAVADGDLPLDRYTRYKLIVEELKNKEDNKY